MTARAARPDPAFDLGVCRVIFYTATLALSLAHDHAAWADLPAVLWHPVGIFRWLPYPLASPGAHDLLQILWRVALAASAIGLFTRASTAVALILGVYLLGLPLNFGILHHHDNPTVLALLALALSPCGRRVSVDALRHEPAPPSPDPASRLERFAACWPFLAVRLVLTFLYLGGAVSKLANTGLAWPESGIVLRMTLDARLGLGHEAATLDLLPLATVPALWTAMAAAGLAIEGLYPLAWVSRWCRLALVPAACGMHAAIYLMTGTNYVQWALLAVFWVPWSSLRKVRAQPSAAASANSRASVSDTTQPSSVTARADS